METANYQINPTNEELQGQNKLPGFPGLEPQAQEVKARFSPPTKAEDFPPGETKISHTYENGNKVVFLLLSTGKVARIREGKGSDVEKATMEAGNDQNAFLTAMMAATVAIDGKAVNMFELQEGKMKDFLSIQTEFAELNF